MHIDFSKLFHRASKRGANNDVEAVMDMQKVPTAWATVFYKIYKHLPLYRFSREVWQSDPGLFASIAQRKSGRSFAPVPVTTEELSTLLLYSCGEIVLNESSVNRAQPSAGFRYPVEAYILIFRPTKDLAAGVYHYNVSSHALECISVQEFTKADIRELFMDSWVEDVAATIVLTGVFSRTQMKYGPRGYRYVLLEAGHIGQNVYLVSQALGLQCCGMGGSYDASIEALLNIDGEHESVVYALAVGKESLPG